LTYEMTAVPVRNAAHAMNAVARRPTETNYAMKSARALSNDAVPVRGI
jgi:hypothetical protein